MVPSMFRAPDSNKCVYADLFPMLFIQKVLHDESLSKYKCRAIFFSVPRTLSAVESICKDI